MPPTARRDRRSRLTRRRTTKVTQADPSTSLGMTRVKIRKAIQADIPQLLSLMRELAEFEKYADAFAITEDILHEQGFRRSPPDFNCLVAEEDGKLVGLLVYY